LPPNITLLHLLPYSPELNAIGKVWQDLRGRHFSGGPFSGTEAIIDACCAAPNVPIAETVRIRSRTNFKRARRANQ